MDEQTFKYMSHIPKWIFGLLAVTIVTLGIALTVIAVTTDRSVSFWPPQIGDGPKPKIAREVTELHNDVIALKEEYLKQLYFTREQLAINRERHAGAEKEGGVGYIQYGINANDYEIEVKNMESGLAQKLQNIDDRVAELERKLDSEMFTNNANTLIR